MEYISFIPPGLYKLTFIFTFVLLLSFITIIKCVSDGGTKLLDTKPTFPLPTLVLAVVLTLFMGLRPHTGEFIDTTTYIYSYENFYDTIAPIDWSEEWLWSDIAYVCKLFGLSSTAYLVVIDVIYIGTAVASCWILTERHPWITFMFMVSSFSFYFYGINGIRNGAALNILLLAIALIAEKRAWIIGAILCATAFGIHRTSLLPIAAMVCSIFFIKEPKHAIYFWLLSIVVSLLTGNTVANLFAGLGFDDRMSGYLNSQNSAEDMSQFSESGFRFDFLLYSAMPVLMTWYVTVKRQFHDRTFNTLAITYILSNAFWVMVIRAAFSNRFAYLSWFLYPVIIAYPLLRFRLWKDQGIKVAFFLFLHAGFTYFMYVIKKW